MVIPRRLAPALALFGLLAAAPAMAGQAEKPSGSAMLYLHQSFVTGGQGAHLYFQFAAPAARFHLLRLPSDVLEGQGPNAQSMQVKVDLDRATVLKTWREEAGNGARQFSKSISTGALEPGVYAVHGRGSEGNQTNAQAFIITDLGLLAKRAGNRILVWSINRRTGQPYGKAAVQARLVGGVPAKAVTDANGLAEIRVPAGKANANQNVILSGRSGEHLAYENVPFQAATPASGPRAFAWADPPVAREGDMVRVRLLAQDAAGKPRANTPVAVKWVNKDGKAVHTRTLKTDAFGFAEDAGKIENLPAGVITTDFEIGKQITRSAFLVTDAPEGSLLLRWSKGPRTFAKGVRPQLELTGQLALGEPLRKTRVRYSVYPTWSYEQLLEQNPALRTVMDGVPVQPMLYNRMDSGTAYTDDQGRVVLSPDASKLQGVKTFYVVAQVLDRYGHKAHAATFINLEGDEAGGLGVPGGPGIGGFGGGGFGRRGGFRGGPAPAPGMMGGGFNPLTLTSNADTYRRGDWAEFVIDSQVQGLSALFTLEGDRIHYARVLPLAKGRQTVRMPLTPTGNDRLINADVVTVGPNGVLRATRLIALEPGREGLKVQLSTTPSGPGQVEVKVRTTDGTGRPVPARVVAELEPGAAGGSTWDFARVLSPVTLPSVFSAGIGSQVWWPATQLPMLNGVMVTPRDQGDTTPAGIPSLATITTDARGTATFRLPWRGALADYRLVARAVTKNGASAQGQLELAAVNPVSIRILSPAAMAAGDTLVLRAEVENRSDAPRSVSVRWKGNGLEAMGVQPALVSLPAGARQFVEIPVRAAKVGPGTLTLTADSEKGLAIDRAEIPVVARTAGGGDALRQVFRVKPMLSGGQPEPLKGTVAPGEEIEVRLAVSALGANAPMTIEEPLPAGFVLVEANAPADTRLQVLGNRILITANPPVVKNMFATYRLRAAATGECYFAPTRVLVNGAEIKGGRGTELAVVDFAAPRLSVADRSGDTLRLRLELGKRFSGPVAGTVRVRVMDEKGQERGGNALRVTLPDPATAAWPAELVVPVQLPPALVADALVEATFEGSGALALPGARIPLHEIRTASETRLQTALGQPMTQVLGQTDLIAGTQAALRVVTLNSRGALPLEGAAVRILFQPGEKGGKPVLLSEGTTDAAGTISARFLVPEALKGSGQLIVETACGLGEERVVQSAKVEERVQMLLTTDKPIYQPGQKIHIRSLSLRKPDQQPLADAALTLEVADPKGNKVFKQRLKTNEFGVASGEFQLADEINLGNYVVRAITTDPEMTVEKTLQIKKYVLPKFKIELSTERPYYLPGERLKGTMKVNYFFGKPVANGTVELNLSTFVTQFEQIAKLQGKTNAQGEFTFEHPLPQMFVGQPLQQGNATVMVEAAVTDAAEHKEAKNHSVIISKDPINLAVIPESGALAPGLENRVYVAATYPDGRPAAKAKVTLKGAGLPEAGLTGTADDHGLAQVAMNVPATQLAALSLTVQAQDDKGHVVEQKATVPVNGRQESLLLRLDRSIYDVGQTARLEILSTMARGSVYVDVIRNRQTVLTSAVELQNGRASLNVPMTPDTAGSLEFRAYKILSSSEIVRDNQVAFCNPASDLRVQIKPGKDTYRPGEDATVDFAVTDGQGNPVRVALGVNIVDESVFALQELQPGLEKLYFTLEKELMQPRYEIHWNAPSEGQIFGGAPNEERQTLARVLFAAVEMVEEYSLQVNTQAKRVAEGQQAADRLRDAVQNAFQNGDLNGPRDEYFKQHGQYPEEREGLAAVAQSAALANIPRTDPWGQPFTLLMLGSEEQQFVRFEIASPGPDGEPETADDLRSEGQVYQWAYYTHTARAQLQGQLRTQVGNQFNLFSRHSGLLGKNLEDENVDFFFRGRDNRFMDADVQLGLGGRAMRGPAGPPGFPGAPAGGFGGGGFGGAPAPAPLALEQRADFAAAGVPEEGKAASTGGGAPPRIREYFPETLYTNPALITDAQGRARVNLQVADSITTWRITALANSARGQIGSVTAPLRVFQDFFVDLDLPVALTQNDEVQIPVAIYNYLPGPQQVKLRLQVGDEDRDPAGSAWFQLVNDTAEKTVDLKRDEVTVRYFRVKAMRPGVHRLTVFAQGTGMSDAIRRQVEVTPDGREIRSTVNDRLEKGATARINIPEGAIPGSAKLQVKLYPGVFSQVVEGLDSMLRMPNGCFEQTTSSTYPNILVTDYMKRTKQIRPEIQMKAEQYINVGYQKLLTFQAADGGFSLWAQGQPETFLTAFGIMQLTDMSKVHDVDPEVIRRAQAWLLSKQQADGSWPVSPTAHQERASKSGVFAFTAYATWALAETRPAAQGNAQLHNQLQAALQKSVQYLKDHMDDANDAYLLALIANAMVSYDRTDRFTQNIVTTLAGKAKEDEKTAWWEGTDTAPFTAARDKTADLETSSLAAYALVRSGGHGALTNKALTYLVRNKDSYGTWYSTQPTIMSLKAMIASMGASLEDNAGTVQVFANGKQVGEFKITADNSDVVQQLDLAEGVKVGENAIELKVDGKVSALYQVTGASYVPWNQAGGPQDPQSPVSIDVKYDKTTLKADDMITANVKVVYNGEPAYQLLVDLGIPPGFQVEAGDLAEARGSGLLSRFDITGRQVIVYLNNVKKGQTIEFSYRLKAKFPVRAKAPRSVVYDYYSPDVKDVAKPVDITVTQ